MITASFFGIAGVVIWGVVIVLALIVCVISSLPGFRRSQQDPSFKGLDRREDRTSTDFLSKPIFRPFSHRGDSIMSTTDELSSTSNNTIKE